MNIRSLRTQQGLSLVEIMVAMVLSLILIGGVLQVFLGSKTSYRVNEALSRLQEDGRFSMEFLTRDVRMAGYSGCTRYGTVTNTLKNQTNLDYDFTTGLTGYDNVPATPPAALAGLSWTPRAGTDVLVVRRDAGNPVRIIKNNNGAQLFADSTSNEPGACADGTARMSGLCKGDILMVTDCTKSRVFQAGNLTLTGSDTVNVTHPSSGSPGNDPSSWGGASAPDNEIFRDDAFIVKVATYAYYVADNADAIPTLFRQDGAVALPIAQGVDDLQVLYGVDTSPSDPVQSADIYVDAAAVTDWSNVVSVRLHLLLRSLDNNITGGPQTYRYQGAEVAVTDANDRYLRKEFTALVAMRNRLR
jgi:type IV pilus assembly protein PilW